MPTLSVVSIISITISIIALIASFWVAWATSKQRRVLEKEMSLGTYYEAIRGILDLKQSFANRPDVFEQQMGFVPDIRELIPSYMDIPTFLTFASAMWRLSYVYTAMKRGEEMGLSANEVQGIKDEMLLWLRDVPGFYDIFTQHVQILKVHNRDFLEFLETEVYNPEYRREAEPKRLARIEKNKKTS